MHLLGKLDLNSDGLVSALEDLVGEDGVDDCDDMMTDLISVWSDDLLILDEVQLDAINNDDQLSTEDELYQLLLLTKHQLPRDELTLRALARRTTLVSAFWPP